MPIYGVAVTIPEPYGDILRRARRRFGDDRAGGIPPHVTLLPPTELTDPQRAALVEHLSKVAATRTTFEMALSGTASFRPVSPVVYVRLTGGSSACAALESAIRSGPIERKLDFPFHPHVTVAHHLPDDQLDAAAEGLADFAACFAVTGYDLYEQDGDEAWHPVKRFALKGDS